MAHALIHNGRDGIVFDVAASPYPIDHPDLAWVEIPGGVPVEVHRHLWNGSTFELLPGKDVTVEAIKEEADRRIAIVEGMSEAIRLIARYVKTLRTAADSALSAADRTKLDGLEVRFKKITDILDAADDLEISLPSDFDDDRHWPASG